MAITWSEPTFSGSVETEDKRAALRLIKAENDRRAALDPPGTPLPTSTNPEIAASTKAVSQLTLQRWWNDGVEKAKEQGLDSLTQDDVKAVKAAIVDRLNNGETAAQIITDLQS